MRRLFFEVDGVVDTGRVGRRVLDGGVTPRLNGHDWNVRIEEDQWNGIQIASGVWRLVGRKESWGYCSCG